MRVIAYDEDDDGFKFSRTRAKKTKTEELAPAPAPAPAPPSKPAPVVSKRRTRNSLSAAPHTEDEAVPAPKRRSARLSGENVENGPNGQVTPLTTKATRTKKADAKLFDDHGAHVDLASSGALNVEKKRSPKKIALPFADTPVIRRNKEMRKNSGQGGQRRSSSGLRGRRASSLIDSGASNGTEDIAFNTAFSNARARTYGKHRSIMAEGRDDAGSESELVADAVSLSDEDSLADDDNFVAVPHAEVEATDFYKLIEQSLTEPRRMKQLLIWCGTRALPEKPQGAQGDTSAIMMGMCDALRLRGRADEV